MIKKIKTFIRLKPQLKIMILQVLSLSVYTGFLFTFFNRHARFGQKVTNTSQEQAPDPKVNDIARAIQIAGKYIPWKNVCRHQAYQAMQLCNFYKIPCLTFIGLKKDKVKNEIQAHAWTMAGGRIISGFCNPKEYIVQSIYRNKWQ